MRITDAQLRPYGYRPGNVLGIWCAGCGRMTHPPMHPKAFKCRPCATFDFRMVEKDIANFGELPANPVPEEFASAGAPRP